MLCNQLCVCVTAALSGLAVWLDLAAMTSALLQHQKPLLMLRQQLVCACVCVDVSCVVYNLSSM